MSLKGFAEDLAFFLAVRKIEDALMQGKGVFLKHDQNGGVYQAFNFRWRGKVYECDWKYARSIGALAAINHERNRQRVIAEMTPRDWAEL